MTLFDRQTFDNHLRSPRAYERLEDLRQIGGFMLFHRGHLTMHQAGAWLPWVLWALERFRRSAQPGWFVLAGTLMALSAFADHADAWSGCAADCGLSAITAAPRAS